MGAFAANNLTGSVSLLSGATGSLLHQWDGAVAGPNAEFGSSLAYAGDVNGDGSDDLIIGSDHRYFGGGFTGFARVYSGQDGSLLQDYRNGDPSAGLGVSVAGLGDVNGDGLSDLLVAARVQDTASGTKSGIVYAFSGAREGILFEVIDLVGGDSPTVRLSGCDPSSSVIFAWSLIGAGPTSSPLGLVALSQPFEQTPLIACNAQGVAEFAAGALPPSASQRLLVWAQAAELYSGGGGQLSLPLSLEVQ